MNDLKIHLKTSEAVTPQRSYAAFGRRLIQDGKIAPWQLFHALNKQSDWDATVTEILSAKGWLDTPQALEAHAAHFATQFVNLTATPPDPKLSQLLSPEFCLKYRIIPFATMGDVTILVTSRPDRIQDVRRHLPAPLQDAVIAVASEDTVTQYLSQTHRRRLTKRAETRTSILQSCRRWDSGNNRRSISLMLLFLAITSLFLLAPGFWIAVLTILAIACLSTTFTLKLFALVKSRQRPQTRAPDPFLPPQVLPRISVMVPLFHEREIAKALIARLSRLTYPKALLEVILVLEERDELTHKTIAATTLPQWIRVVEVPAGSGLTTKPRALNYALDFCKGDIIGIWDAEDAPAPDQLEHVASHFAQAPADVACLQGILDYYNPYTNWLSRCFTIEYSSWFRVILPGLSRLGFAVPLGGTTLFLRRAAIEDVGGWDAHNVTEDADLGIRLARYGYTTELITTVTQEEANCRLLPWIRQRSRWLKGYMITYLVHMRAPLSLWKEIGPRKFLGLQVVFACSLTHFLLAPVIWLFLLASFGMPHPITPYIGAGGVQILTMFLIFCGVVDVVIGMVAISGQNRRRLIPWIFTMGIYFTLATLAAYKALFEFAFMPFYWDKTTHGTTQEGLAAPSPDLQSDVSILP